MIIRRLFSRGDYKAGTKLAKVTVDSSTGIPDSSRASSGKYSAKLSSDAVGRANVTSRGKDAVLVQHDYRTRPKKRTEKGPSIPGFTEQVEKITRKQAQERKGSGLSPKAPKRKVRFEQYDRTDSGDAVAKYMLTDGSSVIKVRKRDEDLFGFGRDLTGISIATRDSSGRKLKKPAKLSD